MPYIGVIIENILIFAVMALVGYFVNTLGWQFALGGLFGIALAFVTIRLHHGRWI